MTRTAAAGSDAQFRLERADASADGPGTTRRADCLSVLRVGENQHHEHDR